MRCNERSVELNFEYLGQQVTGYLGKNYFHLDLPANDEMIAYTLTNCEEKERNVIYYLHFSILMA